MRFIGAVSAALATVGSVIAAPSASAQPPPPPPPAADCNHPACTPGIAPGIVLGSYCANTTHYVFGVTSWGRLVFCGSPRRYEPRWFRSPEMHGIKNEGALCVGMDGDVAQAPDGLFLSCNTRDGRTAWEYGGNA